MPGGGAEVAVGALVQSGLGVSAVATAGGADYLNFHLDQFLESPAYITDEGRPEIGGSLYTVGVAEKYGSAPFVSMQGKLRLEYLAQLLPMVGWNAGAPSGGVTPYNPATATADFEYYTIDVKYTAEAGNQYQILDNRGVRLVLDFTPRQAPTFALDTVGGNHQESLADHAEYPTQVVPSPVTAVPAANRTFFGTTGYKVYGFRFLIENVIDNTQQPLGQFTPDDVVPAVLSSRVEALIQMSNATYRSLVYGGSAATAIGSGKQTGALNMRVANGTQHVEVDFTAAEYFLGDPIPVVPTQQLLLPVRARCIGTATVRVDTTT